MIKNENHSVNCIKLPFKACACALICTGLISNTACGVKVPTPADSTELQIHLETISNWCISGIPAETLDITPHDLAVQYGTQIAIDEINAAGGIGGTMIAFSFDQSDTKFRIAALENTVQILLDPEGIVLKNFPTDTIEASTDFSAKYTQMFGTKPDTYAITAYYCVHYIQTVLEQASPATDPGTEDIIKMFSEN